MLLNGDRGVLVLMYHRLGTGALPGREAGEEVYAITEETFAAQMAALAEAGCPVVPLDAVTRARAAADLPARAVAITFDDGNASDLESALPILQRHRFPATFFITPAWVGTDGYMTWDEVRALRSAGMSVGAHGLDHTLLSNLDGPALRGHLEEARRAIERETGSAPAHLSLPGGAGGARAVAAAHEAGFELVANSVPRLATASGSPADVPRFAVRRADGPQSFRRLVERDPLVLLRQALRHRALTALRGLLGEGCYARLRRSAGGS